MNEQIIFLVFLILLSGYFSGTEIAFVVANKIKMEVKARKKDIMAVNTKYFINNPQTFFSSILIGNNVVNIAFASLSTVILFNLFGLSEVSILIISSSILLLFGEIIPKYFAHELADRITPISSVPLRGFTIMIYPVVKLFSALSDKITQSENLTADNISHLFDKEDIKVLVKESEKAGLVDKKDSDIITRVFELGDQNVNEAMTPRTDIIGVDINQSIDEAISVFIDSGFSKLPVYEDSIDNIKGIILVKDIFKSPTSIRSVVRDVVYIPETKKSFDILNEFLEKKVSIAIVVDEHGGTAGIVTIEDILEELFGEIKDEYDVDEFICRKISDGSYIISGKVEIDHVNEKYNLRIEEGDYETIAGYIMNRLGRIPTQGENLIIDRFNLLIARASAQKIEIVKLTPVLDH